jgi:uncharacterized protein (TIGR03435 family)
MRHVLAAFTVAVSLCGSIGIAQTDEPHFDSASVKRSSDGGRGTMLVTPGGVSYVNVSLVQCLMAAFDVNRHQIVAPDWLVRERYVITARTGTSTEPHEVMRMLASLLVERFHLEFHRERRELLVYTLRRGKGTLDLKPAETRGGVLPAPGGMTFQGMTMTEFVDEFLPGLPSIDRPVIDRTGLDGRYTFSLRVFDDDPPPGEIKNRTIAGGPELFIHALEQIGLVLVRERMPNEVLVVDRADKLPTED